MSRERHARPRVVSTIIRLALWSGHLGGLSAADAWAAPIEQHLAWSSNTPGTDPTNSIGITWSDSSCSAGSVSFGTTSGYGSSVVESVSPFTVPGESVCSHHVALTGLIAGTTYHYSAGGSADHTFTTSLPAASFAFVAYGDQGTSYTLGTGPGGGCSFSTPGGAGGVNGVPEATAQQASQSGAALALYMGDCSYGSGISLPWDQWFSANTPVAADRAWLAAVGNHDEEVGQGPGTATDSQNFFGRFFYPPPFAHDAGWWSVDVSGVHFIFLSGDLYANSQQLTWLQTDLASAAAQAASWRIAIVHQPAFNSSCFGGDSYEDGVRTNLVPIFDSFATTAHVDLVLQGHRHVYERTYMLQGGPLQGGGPVIDTADYNVATKTYTMSATAGVGSLYVTTGAGGHSLHGWASTTPPAWSANRNSFFHWMKFNVSPSQIDAEVHDTQNNGAVWETFSIVRGATAVCGPANCSGCCDPAGACQTGNASAACGSNGSACQTCGASFACQGGACSASPVPDAGTLADGGPDFLDSGAVFDAGIADAQGVLELYDAGGTQPIANAGGNKLITAAGTGSLYGGCACGWPGESAPALALLMIGFGARRRPFQ